MTESAWTVCADGQIRCRKDLHGDPIPPMATVRFGTIRFRNNSGVFALNFGPKGRLIASGELGCVRIWDAATGVQRSELELPLCLFTDSHYPVGSVAFSRNGEFLGAASENLIVVWELATKGKVVELNTACVGGDGDSGPLVPCLSPAVDSRFVTNLARRTIRPFGAFVGKELTAASCYVSGGHGCAHLVGRGKFGPLGRVMAIRGWHRTNLCDLSTGKITGRLEHKGKNYTDLIFSPDGRKLFGTLAKSVDIWDVETRRLLRTIQLRSDVRAIAYGPGTGRITVSASGIRAYQIETGKELFGLKSKNGAGSLAFASDGSSMASGRGCSFRVWDLASRKPVHEPAGHDSAVGAVAISPDGQFLATGSYDGTVRLWDVRSSRPVATLPGHRDYVSAVAFSPDGRQLASVGGGNTVRLWQIPTGTPLGVMVSRRGVFWCLQFSPDGRTLVTGGVSKSTDKRLAVLWNTESSNQIREVHNQGCPVAITPDGSRVVSLSEGDQLNVWGIQGAGQPTVLAGGREFYSTSTANTLNLARDVVAIGDVTEEAVEIVSLQCGETLVTFRCHQIGILREAVFSPDGTFLAAEGDVGTIYLWNIDTGRRIAVLNSLSGRVHSLAFGPDGRILVSGHANGTALLWPMPTRSN